MIGFPAGELQIKAAESSYFAVRLQEEPSLEPALERLATARDVAAALNRDPATLSRALTRFAVQLQEEPVFERALERLAKTIKI